MSHATSPSTNCRYGVVRVCQECGLSRATFYHQQGRVARPLRTPTKRGPKTACKINCVTGYHASAREAGGFDDQPRHKNRCVAG